MKIHTRTVFDIATGEILADESFEYSGPVALCDRSVQGASGQNSRAAGATASGYGAQAGSIAGTVIPTLTNDINNPQGYTPTQTNNQLVAGEQGAGGAGGSIAGEAQLRAERTRNSGSTSGILDQAARRTAQTLSGNALNVQNKSADLAQQKRASALAGLQKLYGTDVGAQLQGMGIQNQDLDTAIKAGQSGWVQNATGVLAALNSGGQKAGPMSYV